MNLTEEVQNLFDHCKNYAHDLLMEMGELFPFGALTDASGRTHHRELEIDPRNAPPNGFIMKSLLEYFEDQYRKCNARGYAMAYEAEVQLDENTVIDTIAIDIRYRDNDDIPMFYFPFSYSKENDKVTFGEVFAVKREPEPTKLTE